MAQIRIPLGSPQHFLKDMDVMGLSWGCHGGVMGMSCGVSWGCHGGVMAPKPYENRFTKSRQKRCAKWGVDPHDTPMTPP